MLWILLNIARTSLASSCLVCWLLNVEINFWPDTHSLKWITVVSYSDWLMIIICSVYVNYLNYVLDELFFTDSLYLFCFSFVSVYQCWWIKIFKKTCIFTFLYSQAPETVLAWIESVLGGGGGSGTAVGVDTSRPGPLQLLSERLISASGRGEVDQVLVLLEAGLVSPDVADSTGHTAVLAASVRAFICAHVWYTDIFWISLLTPPL